MDKDRKAILGRLRDFAEQQHGAVVLADKGSLDRAADVVALYEDRRWATELPPPKAKRHHGRPVDPESFSRFTKWVAEQKVPLGGSRLYQLRDAHDLRTTYFHGVEIKPSGEFGIRPLKWLIRHDHADSVPEVWKKACDLAGGQAPDAPTVRKALTQWKNDNLPKGQTKPGVRGGRAAVDRWLRDAHRIMEEYPELFIDAVNRVEAEAEQYFTKDEVAA